MANNDSGRTRDSRNGYNTSDRRSNGAEVIDVDPDPASQPSYHSQDWYENEPPITVQRETSAAVMLTKALKQGTQPHKHSSARWDHAVEVIDEDPEPASQLSYHSQDWYEHEPPITVQRKTSAAAMLTKTMIQGTQPHRHSSGISLHELSNFQPEESMEDMYLEDILKSGKKKKPQQTNIRATMSYWKLVWFDFKNWYRRWKVKNQEFILFKNYIKTMESNFGSAIGSLFVFTRWLLVLNFFLALLWLAFVVVPSACSFDYEQLSGEFAFKNLLDGQGVISQLWLFYGSYERIIGDYHLGLAYLFLMLLTYFGSLFIILGSIIKPSDRNSSATVVARYRFSLMLWTSWDHSITSNEAAVNLSKGLASALKDNLYEVKATQDVRQRSRKETFKVYARRAVAWLITFLLIGGGCTAIVYMVVFMSFDAAVKDKGTEDDNDFLSVYGTIIVFSMINLLVPSCIYRLPKIEHYASGRDELNITLTRVFVLRMANLFALITSLYNTVTSRGYHMLVLHNKTTIEIYDFIKKSAEGCAGTVIGQELYKLIVMDTILHASFQLIFKFCKHFWTKSKAEFNIPTAILVLIYRQALIWVGTLACPIMPLVGMLSILVLFFVNYAVISRTCKPPIKRWNQSRNTSFFIKFLLASLAILIPPVSVIIGSADMVNLGQTEIPDSFCGPFGADKPTSSYTRFQQIQPDWLNSTLEYLVSEPVVLPLVLILFVDPDQTAPEGAVWSGSALFAHGVCLARVLLCMPWKEDNSHMYMGICSVMVHQRSRISNEKRHNLVLHAELQQEREENEKLMKRLQSMGIGVERH